MAKPAAMLMLYFKKHYSLIVLLFLWLVGLIAGYCIFFLYRPYLSVQMRSVISQPVSIVGLLCTVFFPFLCTYASISANRPVLIWAVCFFKAVAFSFSFACVSVLFGSAAWIIRFLLMFSDICSLLPLFLIWIRSSGDAGMYNFGMSAVFALVLAAVDYFFISPFLIGLF